MLKKNLLNRPLGDWLAGLCFLIVTVLLVWAAFYVYYEFKTSPPFVDQNKYPIKGIDISSHNGDIDFEKVVKDGIRFVYIKASEGGDFRDKKFARNYQDAKKSGLKTGAYHFFRFETEGVSQAINFLNAIGNRHPELGLAIDVELTGNSDSIPTETVKQRLFAMVDYLNLLGHRVTIYTNHDGYYEYIADLLPGVPLWICRFQENPINAEWTFWQYNHHGDVNGIKGDVDLNVFCGNEKEWETFLRGAVWPYQPD